MNPTGYPQGHALLIGVANYQQISSLPAAILNDVNDVAATLSSPKYCAYAPANVVTLLDANATRAAVLKGLEELAARAGPDDTACVFFSGHGGVVGSPGNEDSVLLTVDSDLADIENTSISSDELAAGTCADQGEATAGLYRRLSCWGCCNLEEFDRWQRPRAQVWLYPKHFRETGSREWTRSDGIVSC
jgi:hypothetical protein